MNKLILGVIIGFIIGASLGLFFNYGFTGMTVSDTGDYTYTKAICNSNGECLDVLIECAEGEVLKISPISGIVNFSGHDINISVGNYC